ncbi:MAG: hypothetical protein K2Y32_09600 [Candidatus Obscuribacterales bacterium]|nr:hypothetical protein [Candidatus Obscuribacterales bacterium]
MNRVLKVSASTLVEADLSRDKGRSKRQLFAFALAPIFLTSLADWSMLLYLASFAVFTTPGPTYDSQIRGSLLIFIPLIFFMTVTGYLSEKLSALEQQVSNWNRLDKAKLFRLVIALALTSSQLRQTLGPESIAALLCLILLSSHWSLLFILKKVLPLADKENFNKNLAPAVACWCLGQAVSLKLAPALTNAFGANWPLNICLILYLISILTVYFRLLPTPKTTSYKHLDSSAPIHSKQLKANAFSEHTFLKDTFPHGLMVGLMSLPAIALLTACSIFALQGQVVQTSALVFLPMSELAAGLSLSFAAGALLSPFIEQRLSIKKLWLVMSLLSLSLYLAGAICKGSTLAVFCLYASTALTGATAIGEEARFLSGLNQSGNAGVIISLRNVGVLFLSALIAIYLEESLSLVSSLYFLKELNAVGAVVVVGSLIMAPITVVFGTKVKKLLAKK